MPRNKDNVQERIEVGYMGDFLRDCMRECGLDPVKPPESKWEGEHPDREFTRFACWVRRCIEECNWWELNGGAKNINAHLQVRLLTTYRDFIDIPLIPGHLMHRTGLPSNEGREPAQATWQEWYDKRAHDADLWYRHWCSNIHSVKGAGFGTYANKRLMKIRNIWQLFKNKKQYSS